VSALAETWPWWSVLAQLAVLALAARALLAGIQPSRPAPGATPADAAAVARRRVLALMVEQLPAHIWTVDDKLRFVSAGGRGLEALGFKPQDLTGRSVRIISGAEGLSEYNHEIHARALAGETVRFRRCMGEATIEGAVGPIRDTEGTITGVAGVGIDVTAQAAAEELARATAQTMQEILDHAPASIFIRDLDGRLTFANRSWETFTGRTRQEAVGTTFHELYPPELAEVYERNFRDALASTEAVSVIEKGMVGGEERSFLTVRFPLRRRDGTVYALCGISTDRTDHIRMQEELRRRQELLDHAQAMARLASWETNLRTGERYWSSHMYAILGREPDSVADRQGYSPDLLLAHVVDEDRPRAMEEVMAALFQEKQYRVQYRVRRADGRLAWLLVVGNVERDEDGAPVRFYGFVQDITERMEATQEISVLNERLEERVRQRSQRLEVAVKELSSFSYAVSHDLRQPLRAIAGYMSLLEEEVGQRLPQEARQFIGRVQAAARRMDAIIDDLLALSRVSHVSFERIALDLSAMARDVAGDVSAADPSRDVRWVIEEGLTVHADKGLVRIILQNLFGNAFKFSRGREQAVIELGSEVEDGERVYFVRDNGAGFDSAHAQRLFQPFQRLHDASRFEGTGIGLATVARVVRRHGGWIRAQSAPDQGATFRFTLAAKDDAS